MLTKNNIIEEIKQLKQEVDQLNEKTALISSRLLFVSILLEESNQTHDHKTEVKDNDS